ncbi:MAG: response regulator transcription factor [Lachnospiraceae bacterium]|nr:response regulator transcription factor [Lachnospiraceae bacterium]MBO5144025.1 response regulator transcription factor [Lachnospiraceae bacterium]
MKRNVLIIEDNEACRDALAEITRRCEAAGAVFCAGSSAAAYRYALEETIHLFLVDIILEPENPGDISGLIFAEKIRGIERYKYTPIIFVTSLIDEKLIAYQKLYCSSYIEKPIDPVRVECEIARALGQPVGQERESGSGFYYYRKDGVIYGLETEAIIYIESSFRRLLVYTTEQTVEMAYKPLRAVMDKLPNRYFAQCSKNVIVNKKYIKNIDKANRYITLKDGRQIEIGSCKRKSFLEEL